MAPDPASGHPGFLPYRQLRNDLLGLPAPAWVARCNALAARRDLRSAAGACVRFVLCADAPGALGYEAAIFHEGAVACRPSGRAALHDLHNALVWLTFPRIKATLNHLHLIHAGPVAEPGSPATRRGRMRDVLTLLDESGMLWLSHCTELDAQLANADWRGLLVTNREHVRRQVLPIIIGHGLLEKLAVPYKAMTAHCLVVSRRAAADEAGADAESLDEEVARKMAIAFAAGIPPALAPLPILGLPGWDPANADRSYYDDTRVFRRPRASGQVGAPHA